MGDYLYLIIVLVVLFLAAVAGLLTARMRHPSKQDQQTPPQASSGGGAADAPGPTATAEPETGGDGAETAEVPPGDLAEPDLAELDQATAPPLERPEARAGRLVRLRERLSRTHSGLGRGLLALLSRERLDDDTWEDIEDTLITADVGVTPTQELVERLRTRLRVEGGTSAPARDVLREELLGVVDPQLDRALRVSRDAGLPAVVLMVGVNGTGKTTTAGKLARELVAEDKQVVLAAADTFRAAAVEQLTTWGERVGVPVVRGAEGADPASVAFEGVKTGIETEADVVVVDTAGRLHSKTGLMDELGKVKRVVEKQAPVSEVLLVLDATTGQNGMTQAKVFSEVVDVTGIVLTKLDGSAKGGIVVAVQRELGVPVKLVGVGEGADDLSPFEAEIFVDALLGEPV